MKLSNYLLFAVFVFFFSCSKGRYNPDTYHSKQEQDKILRKTLYYSTKLPPGATRETRFDEKFNWYYDKAREEYDIVRYFVSDSGEEYFLMTRKARSMTPMREGIGGKLKLDDKGGLAEYEEIFRTWKMPADTLAKRGAFLFDKMIEGKDLTMYYSKYQGDRFIEFPDERIVFDKKEWVWEDAQMDSLGIH